MTTIKGMLDRVGKLDLRKQVTNILLDQAPELVKLNREQLYDDSIDSSGNLLESYSSPIYAVNKNKRNPGPGLFHPDLYDTGSFQNNFYAQVKSGRTILFGSTDYKSSDLEDKYGKEIFGLTKDNRRVYATGVFYSALKQYITLTTGLRFQ